jgi:hypothetical protein
MDQPYRLKDLHAIDEYQSGLNGPQQDAIARVKGVWTALPIWRAPCHLVSRNRNQSGNPRSRAISLTGVQRANA